MTSSLMLENRQSVDEVDGFLVGVGVGYSSSGALVSRRKEIKEGLKKNPELNSKKSRESKSPSLWSFKFNWNRENIESYGVNIG